MNNMDLNRLKILVAVVESGSVSAAAKKLFRTQPAVSAQLTQLEAELEIKLFERRGRKLNLTREGEHLHQIVSQQLAQLEENILNITKGEMTKAGILRVAAIPDLGHKLLLPVLKKFGQQFPNIQLHISFGPSELVEEYLLHRRYDIGLVTEVSTSTRFQVDKVVEVENILVAHRLYLKNYGKRFLSIDDVLKADWIDCLSAWRMCRFWFKTNYPTLLDKLLRRKPTVVIDTFQGMVDAVLEGLGLAVVPRYLVKKALSRGVLVEPIRKSRAALYPVFAIQHTNHYRKHVERALLEMIGIGKPQRI